MLLKTRRWGEPRADCLVCVHGLTQHGGVFDTLGRRLAGAGRSVVAVDLRGHGGSGAEPPWDGGTHVADLGETLDALGIERVTWIGHSFGGRVVAAAAADRARSDERLVMLDPGLHVPPARALQSAETERLDWSFASVDSAVEAILASPTTVTAPRDVVAAYVAGDVRRGVDGRFRFRFSPAAAVVAWSEMAQPPPPIAGCPTLILKSETYHAPPSLRARYEETLGSRLSVVDVPNGHNMLWEAPEQTLAAIERFLEPAT